jgi:hypothetical protein
MRLINAKTIMLEEFGDPSPHGERGGNISTSWKEAPSYAVLSHAWGPMDEEVSFQDMQNRPIAESKTGYVKIRLICNQAIQDNIQYVWIDTCCIDKSSSAELSEAINSMYKWYQYASVCYAYLADVIQPNSATKSPDLNSQLHKSRWFTRGWTLQELLAPQSVHFYSAEWTFLGSKHDLCDVISQVTGIHEKYLKGSESIMDASAALKMSWASGRQTTRVEDMAYCLLGIFDVNIALIYGEGKKSFMRLQEEIIKSYEDHTLFAWTITESLQLLHKDFDTSGLLADSPMWFQHCINIVPCVLGDSWDPPMVTSRGLQLQLPIWTPTHSNMPYIPLKCRKQDNMLSILALPVMTFGSVKGVYMRDSSRQISSISLEDWEDMVQKPPPPKIFVMNFDRIRRTQPEIHPSRVGAFVISSIPDGFRIGAVHPLSSWFKDAGYFSGAGVDQLFSSPANIVVVIFQGGSKIALNMKHDHYDPFAATQVPATCHLSYIPVGASLDKIPAASWKTHLPWGDKELTAYMMEKVIDGCTMFVVNVHASKAGVKDSILKI